MENGKLMSDRNIVVNFHKNNREVIQTKDKSLKSKDGRAVKFLKFHWIYVVP